MPDKIRLYRRRDRLSVYPSRDAIRTFKPEQIGFSALRYRTGPALHRAAAFNREVLRGIGLAGLSRETRFTEDQLSDWWAERSSPDARQLRRLVEVLNGGSR